MYPLSGLKTIKVFILVKNAEMTLMWIFKATPKIVYIVIKNLLLTIINDLIYKTFNLLFLVYEYNWHLAQIRDSAFIKKKVTFENKAVFVAKCL